MSSIYYIGIFKNNVINKPIKITGTINSCITTILEKSGIDRYYDFNSFTNDPWNLLFYKIKNENRYMIGNSKYEDFYKDEIEYDEFPVVCNEKVLENGNSYHIVKKKIIEPNYSNFKYLGELNYNLLDKLLKGKSAWESNKKSEFFIDEIKEVYKNIINWILNNNNIYWYQYY